MPLNPLSQVKTVVAIASGKGGTGKSLVTALLAAELTRREKSVAILDADILNPSIPQLLSMQGRAIRGDQGLYPAVSQSEIKVMSLQLLMENEGDPVLWPGPITAKAAEQFWADVIWDEIDIMLIDLPAGSGDVPQTVLENLPLSGVIVVTSPQDMARAATMRAVQMVHALESPLLGLIENYSTLPIAGQNPPPHDIPVLDEVPFDETLAEIAFDGQLEAFAHRYLANTAALIESL
ncbi:MAG: Mrp/NBP35 family ATP-binding protein [Oscillospiraceae bacterium]|nr:Mrp/NBP35 family ATP-binding protein [Oscillospiraceae bacterium]